MARLLVIIFVVAGGGVEVVLEPWGLVENLFGEPVVTHQPMITRGFVHVLRKPLDFCSEITNITWMTPSERMGAWKQLRGWSYREMSKLTAIPVDRLHRIIKHGSDPRATEVERTSAALGISISAFYGEAAS